MLNRHGLMETNKFFDYSTRTEVAAGKHIFKVTNVGVDIDETGDMNSEVRLYYCPDGKNIHDSHVVMMFEVFERELAYMVVHGFYHLMGYDHIEDGDRTIMREKEENILNKLDITRIH